MPTRRRRRPSASMTRDMSPEEQVRFVSMRIVKTIEQFNQEGFEAAALEIALIDAIVRFEKARFAPKATTANVLRKLSVVVLQMATAEESQAYKEWLEKEQKH
jgi:hypothetical protein